MTPLCTRMYTHPFFEATPPGAAPGPPVKNRVPVFATSGGVKKVKCARGVVRSATITNGIDPKRARIQMRFSVSRGYS